MDEITQKVVDGTAWREFCTMLADAGEVILAEGNPDSPLDRAEGFRMLTRLLRGALETKLEYGRPTQPHLVRACHETVKIVAENPDNHYLGASLDGQYDYRIWGTRGDAKWISFNLFSGGGFGSGGPGTGATLHEEQMHIEPDGSFEVFISQREHPVNWDPNPRRAPSPSARRSSIGPTRSTRSCTSSASTTLAGRPRPSRPRSSTSRCSTPASM